MADREKVIEAIKHCFSYRVNGCKGCPYLPYDGDIDVGCMSILRDDTLALLKEQETRVMMYDELMDGVNYLDWYFREDDGGADKDAVKAYDKLREKVFRLLSEYDVEPEQMRDTPWKEGRLDG